MAAVMFTDYSSSTVAATRLLPSSRYRFGDGVLHSRQSLLLHFAPRNPIMLRITATISRASASPSVVTEHEQEIRRAQR